MGCQGVDVVLLQPSVPPPLVTPCLPHMHPGWGGAGRGGAGEGATGRALHGRPSLPDATCHMSLRWALTHMASCLHAQCVLRFGHYPPPPSPRSRSRPPTHRVAPPALRRPCRRRQWRCHTHPAGGMEATQHTTTQPTPPLLSLRMQPYMLRACMQSNGVPCVRMHAAHTGRGCLKPHLLCKCQMSRPHL